MRGQVSFRRKGWTIINQVFEPPFFAARFDLATFSLPYPLSTAQGARNNEHYTTRNHRI